MKGVTYAIILNFVCQISLIKYFDMKDAKKKIIIIGIYSFQRKNFDNICKITDISCPW